MTGCKIALTGCKIDQNHCLTMILIKIIEYFVLLLESILTTILVLGIECNFSDVTVLFSVLFPPLPV